MREELDKVTKSDIKGPGGPTHNAGLFSRETIKHLKTTTADKVEWSHCHSIFAGVR